MALPARIQALAGVPGLRIADRISAPKFAQKCLSFGIPELDQALPDQGLFMGGVVELALSGPASLGTSLVLGICRSLQEEARAHGRKLPWAAFVDPSSTLYGPGIEQLGVDLSRLFVVRPTLEALARVSVRLAESQAFRVIIIDAAGLPGAELPVQLGIWPRVVRKLSLAVEGSAHTVILLTAQHTARPLPLPVAQRIELTRLGEEKLLVQVAKDRQGRISPARPIKWARKLPTVAPQLAKRFAS